MKVFLKYLIPLLVISCASRDKFTYKGKEVKPERERKMVQTTDKDGSTSSDEVEQKNPILFYAFSSKVPANHLGYFDLYTKDCVNGGSSRLIRELSSLYGRDGIRRKYVSYTYTYTPVYEEEGNKYCEVFPFDASPQETLEIPPRNLRTTVTLFVSKNYKVRQRNMLINKKIHPLRDFECKCKNPKKRGMYSHNVDKIKLTYGNSKDYLARIEFKSRNKFHALQVCAIHSKKKKLENCFTISKDSKNYESVDSRNLSNYKNYDFKYKD
jgi:hypothetical protein